ncbi:major head protein [Pseudomonas phage D6]|nr:major head protein [Pseudomonas phage D6]
MAILTQAAAVAQRIELDNAPLEAAINEHLTTQRVIDYLGNEEIETHNLKVIVDKTVLTVAAQAALKAAVEAAGWKEVTVVQEATRVVVSFADKAATPEPDVYVATVTPASPSAAVGATVQLNVVVTKNGQPYSATPTFTSGTPAKATVSSTGLVTGVEAGSSVITVAEAGKYSVTKSVTITA